MTIDLNAGDAAPDFDMTADSGRVALGDFKGKALVLYFYPKDDTSGCTNEAKAFSEAAADFAVAVPVLHMLPKSASILCIQKHNCSQALERNLPTAYKSLNFNTPSCMQMACGRGTASPLLLLSMPSKYLMCPRQSQPRDRLEVQLPRP